MKQFVEVHYFLKDGMRDEFYKAILESGIAAASRAEEGNEMYDYYFSPNNENEVLLIELWASDEAVQQHEQSMHFKKLGELKQQYIADVVIKRYEVT